MDMPASVPVDRGALVQKAGSDCEGRWYLSVVPVSLLQTVDVAIAVENEVLPAHSFVLMANSKVLGELFGLTKPLVQH